MADETENLELVQLREMRVKLEALDRLKNRMETIEKGCETSRFQLSHTFGLAGMANTQALRADEKADDAVPLSKRADERLRDVERRVRVLEDVQTKS